MNRYPDNPAKVSLGFLRTLDEESPPGMWLAQRKLDGWRKIADNTSGTWHYGAKHTKGDAAKPLPTELRKEFESLPWPAGIVLDMEWVGNRVVEHVKEHSLHIFDILTFNNEWLGNVSFEERYAILCAVSALPLSLFSHNVMLVPLRRNPGLVDFYNEQLTDPLSEGLVVRHRDSKLVGGFNGCKVGDRMYKIKYREVR